MTYLLSNTLPFNSYIFLNLTRVRDKINSLCQLPRSGSWRDSHFFTYPVLFKRHGILSRTQVYLHPCTFPFFHLFTSSPFHLFTSSPSHLFTSSPFQSFIFPYSTTINSMSTMPFGATCVLTVRLLLSVFGINGL